MFARQIEDLLLAVITVFWVINDTILRMWFRWFGFGFDKVGLTFDWVQFE
jgi:hypothetical protein